MNIKDPRVPLMCTSRNVRILVRYPYVTFFWTLPFLWIENM